MQFKIETLQKVWSPEVLVPLHKNNQGASRLYIVLVPGCARASTCVYVLPILFAHLWDVILTCSVHLTIYLRDLFVSLS